MKIIRQIIRQGFKTAHLCQLRPANGHHGTECEILRLQTPALQHLAPEIRVGANGFPAHRQGFGFGEPVKTIHQADFGVAQRRHQIRQQIVGDMNIGIAHHDHFVPRQTMELDEG